MPRGGLAGQYGGIPEDIILRKYEQTETFESPSMMDDYQRRILKDVRPDAPFFESDQPRAPIRGPDGRVRGGGFQSRSRLTLRHMGKRSPYEPYLPDGTFLDHQFLEKDPRGTVGHKPDFKKYADQSKARAKFIKFYDDSHNHVPERGIHPTEMQMNIKHGFYRTKDKLKIFSTAFGNRHTGYNSIPITGKRPQVTADGVIVDLNDASAVNRMGMTDKMSNLTDIGWRASTDHRFKVSSYGIQRHQKAADRSGYIKNKHYAYLDHDQPTQFRGQRVSKGLAIKMAAIVRDRKNKHQLNDDDIFSTGWSNQMGRKVRHVTDTDYRGGTKYKPGVDEGMVSANETLSNGMVVRKGQRLLPNGNPKNNIEKTIVNPRIIEFMAQATRSQKEQDPKKYNDLRDDIERTAEDRGMFVSEQFVYRNNNYNVWDVDPHLNRNTETEHEQPGSKKVYQYRQMTPAEEDNRLKNAAAGAEDYGDESQKNTQRRIANKGPNSNGINIDRTDPGDIKYNKSIGRSKLIGHMGNKYTGRYHQKDHKEEDMNDI